MRRLLVVVIFAIVINSAALCLAQVDVKRNVVLIGSGIDSILAAMFLHQTQGYHVNFFCSNLDEMSKHLHSKYLLNRRTMAMLSSIGFDMNVYPLLKLWKLPYPNRVVPISGRALKIELMRLLNNAKDIIVYEGYELVDQSSNVAQFRHYGLKSSFAMKFDLLITDIPNVRDRIFVHNPLHVIAMEDYGRYAQVSIHSHCVYNDFKKQIDSECGWRVVESAGGDTAWIACSEERLQHPDSEELDFVQVASGVPSYQLDVYVPMKCNARPSRLQVDVRRVALFAKFVDDSQQHIISVIGRAAANAWLFGGYSLNSAAVIVELLDNAIADLLVKNSSKSDSILQFNLDAAQEIDRFADASIGFLDIPEVAHKRVQINDRIQLAEALKRHRKPIIIM